MTAVSDMPVRCATSATGVPSILTLRTRSRARSAEGPVQAARRCPAERRLRRSRRSTERCSASSSTGDLKTRRPEAAIVVDQLVARDGVDPGASAAGSGRRWRAWRGGRSASSCTRSSASRRGRPCAARRSPAAASAQVGQQPAVGRLVAVEAGQHQRLQLVFAEETTSSADVFVGRTRRGYSRRRHARITRGARRSLSGPWLRRLRRVTGAAVPRPMAAMAAPGARRSVHDGADHAPRPFAVNAAGRRRSAAWRSSPPRPRSPLRPTPPTPRWSSCSRARAAPTARRPTPT